ncbi:MAG: HAD family hydrolase [Nitrososphaerota archaeon]
MKFLSKIEVYIFDFDGTVIDNEQAHLYSWIEAFKIFVGDINPSLIQHHFGKNSLDIASVFIQDKKQVRKCIKIKEEIYEKLWPQISKPVPCIEELLIKLKNSKKTVAIASSSKRNIIIKVLKHFKLYHYFDIIVGIDNVSNPKPYPDLLLFIIKKLNIAPSEAVYIGDSPIDILTARNAGVYSVYLDMYERRDPENKLLCTPDLTVNSLCELLQLLEYI